MPTNPFDERPRIRTVDRVEPPYPLNKFPKDFPIKVGREIVYILATDPLAGLPNRQPDIEGRVWERIFATAIDAQWKPSNVGLDDIVLGVCAWGAKTVKHLKPFSASRVRLISGRNSPIFSFDRKNLRRRDPQKIGDDVLRIWNERVGNLRGRYPHLRTVVLIKSPDLSQFTIFEHETIMFPPDMFRWRLNERNNLEGIDVKTHRFTWQFHGSQFTIIEPVPAQRLSFSLRRPPSIPSFSVIEKIGFNASWITIHKPS